MRERPPRPSLWIRVAAALLPARYRGEIVDDLVEERDTKIAAGRSRAAASIWLAGHVVRSAASSRRTARERGSWRNAVTSLMPFGRGWPGEWRQAVRALRRTPWYALTVIAVTTLGMALATTVFAVVDGVLFRSLPYPDASELYAVSGRFDAAARRSERFIEMASPNEIAAWAAATDVPVTGIGYTSVTLPDWSVARAAAVDRRFFDVFRVRLLLGGFSEDDYRSSLAEVMPIIISHRVWQTQFGGDPNVIGRTTPTMYSRTYQIVGVMAEDGFVPPLPGSNSAAARRANRVDVLTPPFVEALGERSSVGFARVPDAMRPRALAGLATAAESLRAATSVVLSAVYVFRSDAQNFASRLTAGLIPGRAAVTTDQNGFKTAILYMGRNGHYQADATINGVSIPMMVDTGATTIALSFEDADRLGLNPDGMDFSYTVMTANGAARTAYVTLPEIEVAGIKRTNIRAGVAERGKLGESLPGMNFLSSLS
jgi:clan AA aspartic protease (TIGR02281 family)